MAIFEDDSMATPGMLVMTIASSLRVAEQSIFSCHRALREAGLVSTGGRGLSAAKMRPGDAAILLTAFLGAGQFKDSAEAVLRYQATVPHEPASESQDFKNVLIPGLPELPENHSFVDALTALIAAAADGKLMGGLARDFITDSVWISVLTPGTSAEINIHGPRRGTSGSVKYATSLTGRRAPSGDSAWKKWRDEEEAARKAKRLAYPETRGLKQYRSIDAEPILVLGNLLSDQGMIQDADASGGSAGGRG